MRHILDAIGNTPLVAPPTVSTDIGRLLAQVRYGLSHGPVDFAP